MNRPLTDTGKFYKEMDRFFLEVISAFPEDKSFVYYRDKISALKSINSRLVIETFLEFATPYIEQIMSKDTKFFMEDINVNEVVTDDTYTQLIHKLRSLWISMTPGSQENIWRYFQIFVTYAVKITQRADLLPILNKYRAVPLTF